MNQERRPTINGEMTNTQWKKMKKKHISCSFRSRFSIFGGFNRVLCDKLYVFVWNKTDFGWIWNSFKRVNKFKWNLNEKFIENPIVFNVNLENDGSCAKCWEIATKKHLYFFEQNTIVFELQKMFRKLQMIKNQKSKIENWKPKISKFKANDLIATNPFKIISTQSWRDIGISVRSVGCVFEYVVVIPAEVWHIVRLVCLGECQILFVLSTFSSLKDAGDRDANCDAAKNDSYCTANEQRRFGCHHSAQALIANRGSMPICKQNDQI